MRGENTCTEYTVYVPVASTGSGILDFWSICAAVMAFVRPLVSTRNPKLSDKVTLTRAFAAPPQK